MVYSRDGSVLKLAELIVTSGYERPLPITSKYLSNHGKLDHLIDLLHQNGCQRSIYDGTIPNPTYEQVREGLNICKINNSDCSGKYK